MPPGKREAFLLAYSYYLAASTNNFFYWYSYIGELRQLAFNTIPQAFLYVSTDGNLLNTPIYSLTCINFTGSKTI